MSDPNQGAFLPHTAAHGMHRSSATSPPVRATTTINHLDTTVRRLRTTARGLWVILRPYAGSFALALAALVIAVPINVLLDVSTMSRVFLIAVLISAISYGLWPAMFAALISVLIYDFFFIPPVYSLEIDSAADVINLAFFSVTAAAVSALAARVRRYAVLADRRALTAEKLAAFTRRIGGAMTIDEILARSSEDIAAALATPAVTILADRDQLIREQAGSSGAALDADQVERLQQTWAHRSKGHEAFAVDAWHFLGLPCDDDAFCLIGVRMARASSVIGAEARQLLDAFAQSTVSAVQQFRLRQRLNDARVQIEAEEFGATLLNSISHDLRGPLTAILGATSALAFHWRSLEDAEKLGLVKTAREETEQLNAYIGNLLDMTRLEFGAIGPNLVPLDLADVVGSATYKARDALSAHRLEIDLSEALPLVTADAALLQQTVVNLLDNAAKYAPPGSLITVAADCSANAVTLLILDEGPGLPNSELGRMFDKFYRSPANRGKQPGTGLGLAICRGLVEAMHGTIEARNRTERPGMCISITLPVAHENQLSQVE